MNNPSTALARALVTALIEAGVREVVLAPGSRNAPLSFAVLAAEQAGLLRLHTRIDERSAGFLALGLSKVGARAAVIVTSGTAVANLHPAVLEGAHAGVGFVVISADRPASLRSTGASQTTDQVRMFGSAATFLDIAGPDQLPDVAAALAEVAPAVGMPCLPLHLNVQFTPPLLPSGGSDDWRPSPARIGPGTPTGLPCEPEHVLAPGLRTVVVAGDDAGSAVRVLAQSAGWPVLAEPTSGARTGPNAIRTYRFLLDTDLGRRIERVVVAGHPTLSRPVSLLLERDDVEVISVPARGRWPERPFPVAVRAQNLRVEQSTSTAGDATPHDPDRSWLSEWVQADHGLGRLIDAHVAACEEMTPYEVAGVVARAVPAGGLLVVGASSPIRDLDLMATPWPVGGKRKVIANRGLAGIDGTISTAIGAALGRERSPRNLVLMGDVTFLHESNGLVRGVDQPEPDLTIVVVNDDGGSIFSMLEQGAPEFGHAHEQLFGTPHGVDLAALCAATRTPHWRVESLPELQQALDCPNGGVEVVEVRVRRDNRRELDATLRALAADL